MYVRTQESSCRVIKYIPSWSANIVLTKYRGRVRRRQVLMMSMENLGPVKGLDFKLDRLNLGHATP